VGSVSQTSGVGPNTTRNHNNILIGVIFVVGTIGGWNALSLTDKNVVQ
jgi:hypothetical protein